MDAAHGQPAPGSIQIKVVDFNITTPIDFDTAIKQLGGNQNLFYTMLGRLEQMSIEQQMAGIAKAIEDKNFLEMK